MTRIKGTNWTSPKTNIIAGMLDLRKALASGHNAKLIKAYNEDCVFPIKKKIEDKDFRNYEYSSSRITSVNEIKSQSNTSDFIKNLSLNYVNVYGSDVAMNRYYETGVLDADNFKNVGRSHLVHVDDLIKYLRDNKEFERANMYERQYRSPEHVNDKRQFFDFYRYKHNSPYSVKKFKRKLWVVQLLGDKEKRTNTPYLVYVLNVILYPLKYIPTKSILRMKEYTNYRFRIGGVVNGFSIQIQIPKKFSFK